MVVTLIHVKVGEQVLAVYDDKGKLVSERLLEGNYEDIPCSERVRVVRYGFRNGVLLVIR